jgi:formate dehydrogenase major subunit
MPYHLFQPILPIKRMKGERSAMDVTRRTFLKLSGATALGTGLGFNVSSVYAQSLPLKIQYARESTTICPYCAVGCGIIVHTKNGRVVNTEGDPDHPINEGALCSKGGALYQMAVNDARLKVPLYRAPGSDKWEEKSWEWMIEEIAKRVVKTREETFTLTNDQDETVNRTLGIASMGSAAMDNEECYVYQKFLRGLGLVYIEHQARI